ncbi:MAG TPA: hypothetical protein VHS59_07165 [Bacillota bacterium]|nr:hypothetical protein [Bacillota bacterium]
MKLIDCYHQLAIDKTRDRLAIGAGLIGFVLFLISILSVRKLVIGPLGLVHSLPLTYYFSICCILCSGFLTIGLRAEKGLRQFVNYLLLLSALWLVPMLLEGTPRFASTYKTIGFIEYIYREGTLNPTNWELFYHNWPGLPVWAAVFWLVTGINTLYPVAQYYPFFLHLGMAGVFFWLFRKAAPRGSINSWYLGGVVYLLANFINQDYLSPQSFAYFLLMIFFTLIIDRQRWLANPDYCTGYKLILLILTSAIVISHFLSSLVAVTTLFIFSYSEKRVFLKLAILSLIILAAWLVFGANTYMEAHFTTHLRTALDPFKSWHANIDNRVQGSPEHILVNKVRILYTAAFAITGLLGWLYGRSCGNQAERRDYTQIAIACIVGAGTFNYGGESFIRVYLFLLLPIAYCFLGFLHKTKLTPVLFIFFMLASPLNLIAHYGSEQVDYVSPGIIQGSDFLARNSPGGYVVGFHQILGNTSHTEAFVPLRGQPFVNTAALRSIPDQSYYLGLGPWETNYRKLFFKDATFVGDVSNWLRADGNSTLFYSNGDISLYYVKTQ